MLPYSLDTGSLLRTVRLFPSESLPRELFRLILAIGIVRQVFLVRLLFILDLLPLNFCILKPVEQKELRRSPRPPSSGRSGGRLEAEKAKHYLERKTKRAQDAKLAELK